MIAFTTNILQFQENGDKTGWTYIEIPPDIAEQLQPGSRKTFRVKGTLDNCPVAKISLLPMGGGSFILPLNGAIRKKIGKKKGAAVEVKLAPDHAVLETPAYIKECLEDEPRAMSFFSELPESHQRYFINWIESAKTEATRTKRLALAVTALAKHLGFGEMTRENKTSG